MLGLGVRFIVLLRIVVPKRMFVAGSGMLIVSGASSSIGSSFGAAAMAKASRNATKKKFLTMLSERCRRCEGKCAGTMDKT